MEANEGQSRTECEPERTEAEPNGNPRGAKQDQAEAKAKRKGAEGCRSSSKELPNGGRSGAQWEPKWSEKGCALLLYPPPLLLYPPLLLLYPPPVNPLIMDAFTAEAAEITTVSAAFTTVSAAQPPRVKV